MFLRKIQYSGPGFQKTFLFSLSGSGTQRRFIFSFTRYRIRKFCSTTLSVFFVKIVITALFEKRIGANKSISSRQINNSWKRNNVVYEKAKIIFRAEFVNNSNLGYALAMTSSKLYRYGKATDNKNKKRTRQ